MHTLVTTALLVGSAILWAVAIMMAVVGALKLLDRHTARSKSWNET